MSSSVKHLAQYRAHDNSCCDWGLRLSWGLEVRDLARLRSESCSQGL